MNDSACIRGDLIKWVRIQRGLTMRQVMDLGGPAPSYQSEVEQGKYLNVSSEKLHQWLRVLQVPEAFVRGAYPRYSDGPSKIRGLVADFGVLIRNTIVSNPGLTPGERILMALKFVTLRLTAPVLAYVLGLEVATLQAMTSGELEAPRWLVSALSHLLELPEPMLSGCPDTEEITARYRKAIELAASRAISPEDLYQMISRMPVEPSVPEKDIYKFGH